MCVRCMVSAKRERGRQRGREKEGETQRDKESWGGGG